MMRTFLQQQYMYKNPHKHWVYAGSVGGDGEIRTLELVSELHDFQSCALDRTRRHLRAIIYAVLQRQDIL